MIMIMIINLKASMFIVYNFKKKDHHHQSLIICIKIINYLLFIYQ